MSIYKRGSIYWYKFMWNRELVRESTKQGNDRLARQMEAAHRTRLAEEQKEKDATRERLACLDLLRCKECEKFFNADKAIRRESDVFCSEGCAADWQRRRTMPTLKAFLEGRFIPDAETRHKRKPLTLRYYKQGSDMLLKSKLATLRLDELTDEHAQQFSAEYGKLSPSGINRGLRTLRRALNLAFNWNQLDRPVKVALAQGENQRDRVLTDEELTAYLAACPQPWRDCATIIADEGLRPGEVFVLQWQHVLLNGSGGLIQVASGKSKAARRVLPMTPRVYDLLAARFEASDRPTSGWIFPHPSRAGHFDGDAAKSRHARALKDSGVEKFEPYVLRHTALTKLASKGADAYTLARIAGHSSIVITMRYIHPQADAIERVFSNAYGKARQPARE
ncbi:MAG: tyrosine-type recombinase/integrase [Candidatus Korobacteraceae bacterium]|jgi:integrase